MKIIFLKLTSVFALTLLFSATTLFAQDATSLKTPQKGKVYKAERQKLTPEQKALKKTEKLTEHLGLSEEQAAAVYEINLKHIQDMDAFRSTQQTDRTERMQTRKAMMEQTKTNIAALLTSEQAAILAEWEAKRQEKRQSRRGRGRMGGKSTPSNN
ncbi:MAG: hypothetical protein ACPGVB_02755 [Chitinophagales bacterium]